MIHELPNKSIAANGHAPLANKRAELAPDYKGGRSELMAIAARLDEASALRVPVSDDDIELYTRTVRELMKSEFARVRATAAATFQKILAYNLARADTIDKHAKNGNAPALVVHKVYVNVGPPGAVGGGAQ